MASPTQVKLWKIVQWIVPITLLWGTLWWSYKGDETKTLIALVGLNIVVFITVSLWLFTHKLLNNRP